MKRLFFLLTLINLGLVGWGYFLVRPKAVSLPPLKGDRLELLSERDASTSAPGPSGYDLEQVPADRSAPARRLAPAVPPAVPPSESETSAPPAPSRPESPTPAEPRAEVPTALASAEPAQPQPDSQAQLVQCHTLGPFDKRDDAEQAAARLASLSVAATLREDVTRRENGFWVLIPPLPSRDEARAMEQRLRDAGISDIWRMIKGDLENAVSLGLYTRRKVAERRKGDIVRQGFPAEVRPRYTESDGFWLDFPADARVDAEALKRRFAGDFPELKLRERECVRVNTP